MAYLGFLIINMNDLNNIFQAWTAVINPDLIRFFFALIFVLVVAFIFIDRFSD